MEAELTNSELGLQLSKLSPTDSEKAWHILSLLLSLGCPARPTELASKCTLFYATPNLIEFCCSIPNSPLYLNSNHFVTVSASGYIAIAQFFANANVTLNFRLRFGFELGLGVGVVGQRREVEDGVRTYYRKRKRMRFDNEYLPAAKKREISGLFDAEDGKGIVLALPSCAGNASVKAYFPDGNRKRGLAEHNHDPPILEFDVWKPEKPVLRKSLLLNSSNILLRSGLGSAEYGNEKKINELVNTSEVENAGMTGCLFHSPHYDRYPLFSIIEQETSKTNPYQEVDHLSIRENPVVSTKTEMDDYNFTRELNFVATSCLEEDQQTESPKTQGPTVLHDNETMAEDLKTTERRQEEPPINSCCTRGYIGNLPIDTAKTDRLTEDKLPENTVAECKITMPFMEKGNSRMFLKGQTTLTGDVTYLGQNQQAKFSPKSKPDRIDAVNHRLQSVGKALQDDNHNTIHPPVKQQWLKKDKSIPSKPHLRNSCDQNVNAKEKGEIFNRNGESSFVSAQFQDQREQRVLPDFESFIAEEEEGSGGYGTVYRARRKNDGMTFAIKCPHANANRNHVYNELKMLERFGGKNFIIKYNGSFKSGNSDCLVLDHVEHDRPEVLKRDIDVLELQWYGYCMFRALSGLHKQSVVHRDVKPGNFLFNRKACKGYLIDFNLAMDMNQKYGTVGKTKGGHDMSFDHVLLPQGISMPPTKNKKFLTAKALVAAHQDHVKVSKPIFPSKNMKKENESRKTSSKVGSRNVIKSQCADRSGITSIKDATSNLTPSGEKWREPLPCQGRRELISLVQEALQGANQKATSVPVSKRKRVAAPPRQLDRKFIYLTPMPLHSAGVAVGGAGLLKNKGDRKHNREGPCVGTKGFRAPEVLFRSLHQGPKVDIWSAGVTLLYLMIGRTPFVGDPDQNVKDIAKLRGSEDLWEVAKLHNRESSFPSDLFDMKSLPSMKLQDWSKRNTRRPDFLDIVPRSLFDLLDKCLTVNPRLRISAEEALRHEFFTPCHEALRKHRLLRQGITPDSASGRLLDRQFQTCGEVPY